MNPWHMAQVPPQRWAEFTALPRRDWIEMWTRSDLLMYPDGGVDAFDIWIGLDRYPVQLHCSYCQRTEAFVADMEDDAAPGDEGFRLEGLDERMSEFITAHTGCPLQMMMAI